MIRSKRNYPVNSDFDRSVTSDGLSDTCEDNRTNVPLNVIREASGLMKICSKIRFPPYCMAGESRYGVSQ